MLALNISVQQGFQYGTAPLHAMLCEIVFDCLQFFFFISLLLSFHLFVPVQRQYTTPTGIWQTCVCQLTLWTGQMTGQQAVRVLKLYNPRGFALRESLFLSTQERKHRLSLTECRAKEEAEEYENSSPPGEFSPQWYLLPHGPALSATHRQTPQVFGEGQTYTRSVSVWTFLWGVVNKQVTAMWEKSNRFTLISVFKQQSRQNKERKSEELAC